ncbi:hypothetical protein [Paenibacillus sp. FSL K6-0108]|uniref:hypothetical protein n=1 Tax=Paenibacillus sp. FSL K6-0108 TaxID=2921417 RepID=UPI00324809BA
MKLDSISLYKYLNSIGVSHSYHANTVPTACSFIKAGELLSRGAVEQLGLYQTAQDSDDIDKIFNVWNDIFLDCNDLHIRFGRENKYGPVLFKFKTEFLIQENFDVWITKDNPIRWNLEFSEKERYFSNLDEVKESYSDKSYIEMITLRSSLPLSFDYLEEIKLDFPNVRIGSVSLYKTATKVLTKAMRESEYDYSQVKKVKRRCKSCYCHSNYRRQYSSDSLREIFCVT